MWLDIHASGGVRQCHEIIPFRPTLFCCAGVFGPQDAVDFAQRELEAKGNSVKQVLLLCCEQMTCLLSSRSAMLRVACAAAECQFSVAVADGVQRAAAPPRSQ